LAWEQIMNKANQLINDIKMWAKNRDDIRALILYGSQAQRGKADPLSDIDIGLFVEDPQAFSANPEWAQNFGPVWLRVGDLHGTTPVEKILYKDGTLVDAVIHPVEDLDAMRARLPDHMEPGYKILVDKDKAARNLPKPSGETAALVQPTVEQYSQILKSFWMDAYQLAKYLLRDELWRAKHYDWQLKQHLLAVMGWHALLVRGQEHFTLYEGKHLKAWTDPDTYLSLMTVFGRFYPADSWRALEDTIKRFTHLSQEVAQALDTDHHPHLEKQFQDWLADRRQEKE
jgi:aminoglycoside 6-adenylyltransferase